MQRMLVLRIDDVCPQMDWYWFEKTMNLLEEYNITGLLGVIPDCKDIKLNVKETKKEFWEIIQQYQKKGWCIAMHGYTHVYDTQAMGLVAVERKKASEFAGHTFDEQLLRLKKGKELLRQKDLETDIFFAPSHNYDKNTIRALHAMDFRYISDGRSRYAYRWMGIKFIPNSRVKQAKKGIHTWVLHPCITKEKGYKVLKEFLESENQVILPFQTVLEENDICSRCHWGGRLEEKIYIFFQRVRCVGGRIKHKWQGV